MVEDVTLAAELAGWSLVDIRSRFFPKRDAAMMRALKITRDLDRNRPENMSHAYLQRLAPWDRERIVREAREFLEFQEKANAEIREAALGLEHALRKAAARPNAFCAYARIGSPSAPLSRIPIDYLASFRSVDWTTSTVVMGGPGEEHRLYSVRLVPSLVAPEAQTVLTGSLEELIVGHVWGAPEIEGVLPGAANEIGQHLHGDGTLPIPVTARAAEIRQQLDQALSSAFPERSGRDVIAAIASERLQRVFDLFRTGGLELKGLALNSNSPTVIDAKAWQASDLVLCMSGPALYRGNELLYRELVVGNPDPSSAPPRAGLASTPEAPVQLAKDEQAPKSGRPFDARKLKVLDTVLAQLIAENSKFKSLKEFDRFCAQAWLDANLPIGNQFARDRDIPAGTKPTDLQIRATGEWVDDWLPSVRRAIAGRWEVGDQDVGVS